MNFLRKITDFFLKTNCLVCSSKSDTSYYNLCSQCVDNIRLISNNDNRCPKCLDSWIENNQCKNCTDFEINWNSLTCLFSYTDPAIQMLFKKYKFDNHLSAELDLITLLKPHLLKYKDYTIIPAPCSKETYNRLGFHPVINILRKLKIPYYNILKKHSSLTQKRLTGVERKNHLQDFSITMVPKDLITSNILIIDDVMTTGCTLNSCTLELQKHGFKDISCLCFFRS
ncbi:MAG: ComF family protein [Brevinemataceae bacterium]